MDLQTPPPSYEESTGISSLYYQNTFVSCRPTQDDDPTFVHNTIPIVSIPYGPSRPRPVQCFNQISYPVIRPTSERNYSCVGVCAVLFFFVIILLSVALFAKWDAIHKHDINPPSIPGYDINSDWPFHKHDDPNANIDKIHKQFEDTKKILRNIQLDDIFKSHPVDVEMDKYLEDLKRIQRLKN